MHKDIIYIEQNDDIAGLIAKIKASAGELIVLIPPKDQCVLHNQMNIKLIVKTLHDLGKKLVIVTTDDTLLKFAAIQKIPVAADLKARPSIPSIDDEVTSAEEEVIDKDSIIDESDPVADQDTKKDKKDKAKTASKLFSKIPNFEKNRKWFILGGIGVLAIVAFFVWGFVIAPSVKITASISTVKKEFSENISLTTNQNEEDIENGKLYLTKETYEQKSSVEFEATGERDEGEKASGEVTISVFIAAGATAKIPAGTTFTHDKLSFVSSKEASITYDESKECENTDQWSLVHDGCKLSMNVPVVASSAGTDYNIGASSTGWSSSEHFSSIVNKEAFTGGTSKKVKYVTDSDIKAAKEKLKSENESEGKTKLYEQIPDSVLRIDSSFVVDNPDPVSTPALNGAVEDGKKATLAATTIFSVYTIDVAAVEDYISTKAKISDDYKIYSLGNPFIERFMETDGGYTAKLKTSFFYGPSLTESEIRDKVYGVKIGEASAALNTSNVKVTIESFPFWINSVPKNPNKVKVDIIDVNNNSSEE